MRVDPLGAESVNLRCRTLRAEILSPLGGLLPEDGALVIVHGPPGSGKTTAALELGHELGGCLYADAEMSAAELERAALRVMPRTALGTVRRLTAIDAEAMLDALGDEPFVVIDSLHEWAESPGAVVALMGRLRAQRRQGQTIVVIAHEARAGNVRGDQGSEYRGDVVIRLTPREVSAVKCRWTIPVKVKRGTRTTQGRARSRAREAPPSSTRRRKLPPTRPNREQQREALRAP